MFLSSPGKPFGDERPDIDPGRALRLIRLLGAVNLVLFVALGASLWWGSRGADALRVSVTAVTDDQPVNVFMEARLTSARHPVRTGDTVSDPILTVHGVVSDFARLRDGLSGFAVTVRGTRTEIVPETGEFTERVVLTPGKNQIDLGIWWEGREQQRRHVDVTYIPMAPAPSTEPDQPL